MVLNKSNNTTRGQNLEQESPAVAKKDALQPMQFLLQYWPSKSFKVDDFYFIWNGVYHLLILINSNIFRISEQCFRDMAKF